MVVAHKGLTLEQFLELPEEEPVLEFAEGRVTQKSSPQGQHSRLQPELWRHLEEAGHAGKVAMAFTELRTTYAGASHVPDVAVYRRERVPFDPDGRVANVFLEAPDVAVEIASPDQSVNALVRRCLWYVDNGVSIALVVDPRDESVLAFRPDQPVIAWYGPDHIDVRDMLPDLQLTVAELFSSLRPG